MDRNELKFQLWYRKHAKKYGLNLNPDDPKHYYDYRAAYNANVEPDKTGHWPSQFKTKSHPRMFLKNLYGQWINTKTGQVIK